MKPHPTPIVAVVGLLVASGGPARHGSLLGARPAADAPVPAPASALALEGVTLVDLAADRLVPARTVVIVGTRIKLVGAAGRLRLPAGSRRVDAWGRYLIPGLWDMHAHPMCEWSLAYPLFIAYGVTGIRDAGTGYLDSVLRLRREITSGQRIGPRQVVSGPALGADDFADMRCRGDTDTTHLRQIGLRSPAHARQVVDSLAAAGVDWIKTRLSGEHGPNDGSPAKLAAEREIYRAVAAEARRVGLPLGGHLPWGVLTLEAAAAAGQRLIDHDAGVGTCVPRSLNDAAPSSRDPRDSVTLGACRRLATRLRRHRTWLVPTLSYGHRALLDCRAWEYLPRSERTPEVARSCRDTSDSLIGPDRVPDRLPGDVLALARAAELPLLVGTDAITQFGFAVHNELALFVREGLTPLQALRAATIEPARALGLADSLGGIAPGQLADLVLLDANPLETIMNTLTIRAVVANGRYFDRPALDTLLAQVKRRADAS